MDEEFQEQFHQFKKYKCDFENLAFAGSGAKIASYLGGIMVRLVFVSLDSIEKLFFFLMCWMCWMCFSCSSINVNFHLDLKWLVTHNYEDVMD